MIVTVISKFTFDQYIKGIGVTNENVEEKFKNFCFISIIDTIGYSGPSYFNGDKSNVKILYFDDVDESGTVGMWQGISKDRALKSFSEEQAVEVIDFLENQRNGDICLIHCLAGISRSGAVVVFVNDYFGTESYQEFMRRNPMIQPNGKVLQLLKRELRNRFEEETI